MIKLEELLGVVRGGEYFMMSTENELPRILDVGTHLIPHESPDTDPALMSNAEFAALVELPDGSTAILEAFHEETTLEDGQSADGFDFRGPRALPFLKHNYFVSAQHDQLGLNGDAKDPYADTAPTLPGMEWPEVIHLQHPARVRDYATYVMAVALGIQRPVSGDHWNTDMAAEVNTPSAGNRFGEF